MRQKTALRRLQRLDRHALQRVALAIDHKRMLLQYLCLPSVALHEVDCSSTVHGDCIRFSQTGLEPQNVREH